MAGKSFKTISLFLIIAALLSGCNQNTQLNTEATNTEKGSLITTAALTEDGKSDPQEKEITISCGKNTASGNGVVELKLDKSTFKKGAKIEIQLPEGEHYLAVNISKDIMEEAIVYLPESKFSYIIPNFSYSYPAKMKSAYSHTITARIPDNSELSQSHVLSLNPFDLIDDSTKITGYKYKSYWSGSVYPHASTSSVCRVSDSEESKYQFEARNAIDGYTKNKGHGNYPYQSWGPDSDFSETKGYLLIDFGHDVTVDMLNLYIRADFPHDTYFNSMTVEFSDKSTLTFEISNDANAQTFNLGGKTTSYVKIKKLEKVDHAGWAAITEVEVVGSEIVS